MSSKKLSGNQLKSFRSAVAKLKAKGLVGKRVDARKQRPTRYMREQVKKFGDVLSGKAKVVKVPRHKIAKEFENRFPVKFNKVVVPVKGQENFSYAPKERKIVGYKKVKGRRVKHEIYANPAERDAKFHKMKNKFFIIPLGGGRQSFDTFSELVLFMEPYEAGKNPYKNWRDYVEIVSADELDDE